MTSEAELCESRAMGHSIEQGGRERNAGVLKHAVVWENACGSDAFAALFPLLAAAIKGAGARGTNEAHGGDVHEPDVVQATA